MNSKLKKFIYIIKFKFIKITSFLNQSLYMKLYINLLRSRGMTINGRPIYIGASTSFDGRDYSLITLNDKVVISSDVRFLTHDYSISRAIESKYKLREEFPIVKPIFISENCFIGAKSIIMPGCYLGKNVIVGAGSVVRGRIPDNSIVIGNPARIIKNTQDWMENVLKSNIDFENYIER